jgi:hypothetical protein
MKKISLCRYFKKTAQSVTIVILVVTLFPLLAISQPLPSLTEVQSEENIKYIQIPAELSKETVYFADDKVKSRLLEFTKEFFNKKTFSKEGLDITNTKDQIVIFTDNARQPIFPDLETARNKPGIDSFSKVKGNEITFTFNSNLTPWTEDELSVLKTTLSDCYKQTKKIYGNPAFNITVNVSQDPSISFAGLYYPSINEMVVKNLSTPDPICHELIHAFRDDNLITLSSYEEGMTRAAEVEVFNNLPGYNYWNNNHSYTYDVYYEGLNKQKIGSQNGNLFFGYIGLLTRYELSGYAWAKVFFENSNFLANFNRKLYANTLLNLTTPNTEQTLINIANSVQPVVENLKFKSWYNLQGVLNTNPDKGYFLYQRINQYTVDFFYRDPSGVEIMQPGASIDWEVYDHNNVLIDNGSEVTSVLGWAQLNPFILEYTGRIKVVVTAITPNGLIRDSTFKYVGNEEGCFGIVRNNNSGSITITSLDNPKMKETVKVFNGSFSAPSLSNVRGRFRAVFVNEAGKRFYKWFNKDASNYFIDVVEYEGR